MIAQIFERTRWQVLALVVLVVAGAAAGAGILSKQGSGFHPFRDSYDLKLEFAQADGVKPGVGQPVSVAGVDVGRVVGVATGDNGATVSVAIDRDQLPAVYENATAYLEPLTPLHDLRIELRPGGPPASPLPHGAVVPIGRTISPVPLSALLDALDSDTRPFVRALIDAVGQGVQGNGSDLRGAIAALGPTTHQLGLLTDNLGERRRAIARLVHNVARITTAASSDRRLAGLVQSANATLDAVAREEAPLRSSLDRLPHTLAATQDTLDSAAGFLDEVDPTLTALRPTITRLPSTLASVKHFADAARPALATQLRPLAREARPLVRRVADAVPALDKLVPRGTSVLRAGTYGLNTLAFNPPGDDEGGLFWLSWFVHNWNSALNVWDAHGAVLRSVPFVACGAVNSTLGEVTTVVTALMGLDRLCPN